MFLLTSLDAKNVLVHASKLEKAHLVIKRIIGFIFRLLKMAIYHFNATAISRSSGRSACAAAAYRAAEKITDQRTGIIYDFTRKGGVLYSEIMAPAGSQIWAISRAELWNRAEQAEDTSTRRATATTAREFNIALPHELDSDAQLASSREFALYLVTTYCVAVDFSIHEPSKEGDTRNYHVHFMLTDRRITDAGFADKVRELNIFNGGKANIASIREQWSKIANRFLDRAGVHEGIDHRSYKSQGLNREATTHLGVAAAALERRGETSERGDRNRVAQEINTLRAKLGEVGETMHALELAETCESKEAADTNHAESSNTLIAIAECGEFVSMNAEQYTAFSQPTSAGDFDPADITGRTPDSRSEAAALSEQQKLDQQKVTETLKPSATKITHEEMVKEAKAKAKAAKELRRMLALDHPSRDRSRGR